MFKVYQDSIGSEEFTTITEATEHIVNTIQDSFSVVEIKKPGEDDEEEIEYTLNVKLKLKRGSTC